MPLWLTILLQVIQSVIAHLAANPPAADAPLEEHIAHDANIAKVQAAYDSLKV